MDLSLYLFAICISTSLWTRIEAVDLTIEAGSIGSSVVKACVTKIRNSGIFPEDYDFLRNLAYVDSTDGADLTEYTPGGIWKVSLDSFALTQNSTIDFSAYFAGINSSFNISWPSVVYDNLAIPLYSALARRLHVAYVQTYVDNSTLDSETNQALFWARYVTDTGNLALTFSNRVQAISTGCDRPDRDVVFLIDSSSNSEEVNNAVNFVKNVLTRLKVDSNQNVTVVGLAQYSYRVEVLSYLNSSKSETELKAILSTAIFTPGERYTGISVWSTAFNFFLPANGARTEQTGIPRILCVLLSGDSADYLGGIEEIASSSFVNVIAVAMTSNISQNGLNEVATGDDSNTAVVPTCFPPGSDIEFRVANLICSSSSALTAASSVSGELQQNQERSYILPVPDGGLESVISVTSGELIAYYSTTIQNPSQAYHDQSTLVSFSRTQFTLTYTPTSEELLDGSDINLYLTLQGLSSTTTTYTITVGNTEVTIVVNVETNEESNGFSSGELSAIVFSCIVIVCAIVIAAVYHRHGRASVGSRMLREDGFGKDKKTDDKLEIDVRERLQSAMMKRSFSELNDAVEDFMAMKLKDCDGDFVRAQRMLAIEQCKQGLYQAIVTKNVKLLERSITRGKRIAHDVELKIDIVKAEILLQSLKKTENLLRRLKRTIESEDTAAAEALTTELRILHGCDTAGVKRMLLAFQLREDIEEAMQRRDVDEISDCIARITEKKLDNELIHEMKVAKKMGKDLATVEKARRQVMGLKQNLVSEIRSYQTPPAGLHEVMMSVYLLLGYHPMQLQSWTAIQSLMGKTGREGLRKMIGDLELRNVDVMHARMAKSLIENFDLHTIKELSDALAIFYQFAQSVITEVQRTLPDSESPSFYHRSFDNGYGFM